MRIDTRTSGFSSLVALIGLLTFSAPSVAQSTQEPAPPPHQHHPADMGTMALFPAREASGTAWQPDDTPMYGVERTWGSWGVMLHGVAFAQFLYEPGFIHRTGGYSTHQFGTVNWGMAMARRPLGAGRLALRAMK